MILLRIFRCIVSGVLITLSTSGLAGGFWDECGLLPVKYPGTGTVSLNYDQGNLWFRNKSQTDALVTQAASIWTNVATSTVAFSRGPDLPVDLISSNYRAYLNNYVDGLNPVIYDTDGSITDNYLGAGQKNIVLGFAGSTKVFNGNYCEYSEGYLLINGYLFMTDEDLKGTIAHELGHLIGLDHSQLDWTQGLSENNFPIMYPNAYQTVTSLREDDIASVSALYPAVTLSSTYGQLFGNFTRADGTPLGGANIWAKEVNTGKVFSYVSRYTEVGSYFNLLLTPGTYTLHAEAIESEFFGGSRVGLYALNANEASFQPPFYNNNVAMTPIALGGVSTPTQFVITAGCMAAVTFKIDGTGSIAVCTTDNSSPTIPTGLSATPLYSTQITLDWTPSTDNVNVAFYKIYRNGTLIGKLLLTNYNDNGLQPSTIYNYAVAACDAANNCSALTNPISVTTFSDRSTRIQGNISELMPEGE